MAAAPAVSDSVNVNACDHPLPADGLTETTDGMAIIVGSLALESGDPPPDTLTAFTWGEVALAATFTVTTIGA
jgi:hypothetical protein